MFAELWEQAKDHWAVHFMWACTYDEKRMSVNTDALVAYGCGLPWDSCVVGWPEVVWKPRGMGGYDSRTAAQFVLTAGRWI